MSLYFNVNYPGYSGESCDVNICLSIPQYSYLYFVRIASGCVLISL